MGDRKTECVSTNARGEALSLARDRQKCVGLGRGLSWKLSNQEFVKKYPGRGRASIFLNPCSSINNLLNTPDDPERVDNGLKNPEVKSSDGISNDPNLENLGTEAKNATEPAGETNIPNEHQILLALSQRVLRSFQNAKTTNVLKLSKELNADEHKINMVVFMLYTHQTIEYNTKWNSWSLKTDKPSCECLFKMLEMSKLDFCTSLPKDGPCRVKSNTIPIGATFEPGDTEANGIDDQKTRSHNISDYIPPSLNTASHDLSVCHVSPVAFKPVAPSAATGDGNLLNIARVAGLSGQDLSALQKSPLSAFHEYGQKNKVRTTVEIVEQTGGQHNPRFHGVASVNNERLEDAWADTKKDALREAARKALTAIIASKLDNGKSVNDDTVKALYIIFNNY